MAPAVVLFVAVCTLVLVGVIWAGVRLDRRAQRRESDRWMRGWLIRTRVLRELYDRWHGPLQLQDQRSAAQPAKRSRRRKRSKEG